MRIARAPAAVAVLLLLVSAAPARADVRRQQAPLRLAGGDYLASVTDGGDQRLRRLDPSSFAPEGRAIPIQEDTGVRVVPYAKGRRFATFRFGNLDGSAFVSRSRVVRMSRYDSASMRRIGTRAVRTGFRDPDEVLQLSQRRVALVGERPRGVSRLAVVDPADGRLVRTVALGGEAIDALLLGRRAGVLVQTATEVRLQVYDSGGRLRRTVRMPFPPAPAPPPGQGRSVTVGLRYADGEAVVLRDVFNGPVSVVRVALATGAVTSRDVDQRVFSEHVGEPELVALEGATVRLTVTRPFDHHELVTVGPDGTTTAVAALRGGVFTVSGGRLLGAYPASVVELDGRPRWTGAFGYDLEGDVALLGDRVLHRADDDDAITTVLDARTGRRLRRFDLWFSLLPRPTGGGYVYGASPEEALT